MGTHRPWLPADRQQGGGCSRRRRRESRRPGVVRLRRREEEGGRRHEPVGDGAHGNRRDAVEGERSGGFTEK
jgi:hypothetical protein